MTVRINRSLSWPVPLNGTAASSSVDRSSGRLASFELNAAAGRIRMVPPPAFGQVPLRISGAALDATVAVPAGTGYRVRASGLAVSSSFHGPARTAGYQGTANRYAIEISGPASRATLDVTPT